MNLDLNDIINSFKNFGINEKELDLNLDSLKFKPVSSLFNIDTVSIMKNLVNSARYSTLELETLLEYVNLDLLLKRYPFLKDCNPEEIRKHLNDFIYGDTLIYNEYNYPDIQNRIFHFSSYVKTDSLRIFWLHLIVNYIVEKKIKLNADILGNIRENLNYFLNFPKNSIYFEAKKLSKYSF